MVLFCNTCLLRWQVKRLVKSKRIVCILNIIQLLQYRYDNRQWDGLWKILRRYILGDYILVIDLGLSNLLMFYRSKWLDSDVPLFRDFGLVIILFFLLFLFFHDDNEQISTNLFCHLDCYNQYYIVLHLAFLDYL